MQNFTAEHILRKAAEDVEIVQEWLEMDHTATVYRFQVPSGENARTAAYSYKPESQLFRLLRLHCARDLAFDYMHVWQRSKLPERRYGSTGDFVQKRGLPEKITKKALKSGQKLIRLEEQCGIPGISLVLLPAWYMFEHFTEIDELAKLLLIGQFKELYSLGVAVSQVLSTYQDVYVIIIARFSQAQ
jgi:hypothetical protein